MRNATAQQRTGLGVFYLCFFVLDFDFVVINPLLVPIAETYRVSLGTVTFALTAYLLLFGIMQPVHGIISDAVGRMRVLRVGLLGIAVGDLVAAIAPNAGILIAGRAIAGAFCAAVIPMTLAYVGERVPVEARQRTMASLLAASALGAAASTLLAGFLTHVVSWRPALFVVAVSAVVLAVLCGRVAESFIPSAERPSPLRRIGQAFEGRWFRFLVAFTLVEGAAMVGFFNFFTAALEVRGHSILIAGLVTSAYGLAALVGVVIVGRVGPRASAATMFAAGGIMLFVGFAVATYSQGVLGILVASAMAGLALSVGQSTIQTWAVELAAPGTLGTALSLVACSVFTSAAIGTAAVGGLASTGEFGQLFMIAAAVTALVTIVGTVARSRFVREHQAAVTSH